MLGKKPEAVDSKLPDDAIVIDEVDEADEPEAPSASPGRRPSRSKKSRAMGGMPNVPSFRHSGGKTPKPRLKKGEKILKEGSFGGVKWVWTSDAAKIFLCSIEEYLDKVGPLKPSTAHYRAWFPHATSE